MTQAPTASPELHSFPLPAEAEGVDFAELATEARTRFSGELALMSLAASETLSYRDNIVKILFANDLPGGNFKFLTAGHTVAKLREQGNEEFIVPTAGSYGIALALAVAENGGRGVALLPRGSNQEKQDLIRELGAEALEVEDAENFDETDKQAKRYAEEHGLTYVHPFASVSNAVGAGVLGLEIAERIPDATHSVAQYGGGSLHGGMNSVLGELRPEVHRRVVQVRGCSPFVKSVRSGETVREEDFSSHITSSFFRTLGGVGVGATHPLTLGIGSRNADSVDTVEAGGVYPTMHDVYEEHGVLPEFAGAVGLEGARKLARTPGLENAIIVAVLTGDHADMYTDGWLARKSERRCREERAGIAWNTY